MNTLARLSLLALGPLLVACSTAEDPTVPVADTGKADTAVTSDAAVDTFVADAAAADTSAVDTAAPVDSESPRDSESPGDSDSVDTAEAAPPPMPVDCFTDDFGPSSVSFVDFFYQQQVGACEASSCSDFVMFDTSCVMTLQVADIEHKATLSPPHCAMFQKWLSSDLLVSHLRDSVTCAGKVAGIYESSQITLSDGTASKKTFMCPDEPFASHRACIMKLRATYFPGI
jgi:hypothetical protein